MKEKMLIGLVMLSCIVLLGAGLFPTPTNKGTDGNGNFIQDGVPSAFVVLETTKAAVKYSVRSLAGINVRATANSSVYLNGTGGDWPLDANVAQKFRTFSNISTMVFTCQSSASTKFRIQQL